MAEQNDKAKSAQDLLREGYYRAAEGRKETDKKKPSIAVELTEIEAELPPVYWMAKWYSANKKEKGK